MFSISEKKFRDLRILEIFDANFVYAILNPIPNINQIFTVINSHRNPCIPIKLSCVVVK